VRFEIARVSCVLRIGLASLFVNENRARKRDLLDAAKRVIREEDSVLLSDMESPQTLSARTVSPRDFGECRMPIVRSLLHLSYLVSDFFRKRYNFVLCHDSTSWIIKIQSQCRPNWKSVNSNSCGQTSDSDRPANQVLFIDCLNLAI
jgi:hypothetical protein